MKKAILKVLKYFSFFDYPPTFEEIYTFLSKKTTKKELKKELERLVNKKIIKNLKLKIKNSSRYTVGEYGIETQNSKLKTQNYNLKFKISQEKIKSFRFNLYIRLLSLFSQIKLVGLSGSLAMMNAGENDDIDLFIITAKNRLFTGRFIAVVLAWILGIKRNRNSARPIFITRESHSDVRRGPLESEKIVRASSLKYKNKVCLNLFFDESNLEVPSFKKTEFVAHEVLQMKPIINKNQTYEKFLLANKWVLRFFPNAKILNSKFKIQSSKLQFKIKNFKFYIVILRFAFWTLNFIAENIEKSLKGLQLYLINRHRTTEIITDSQLWFHPDDFEKKIKLP